MVPVEFACNSSVQPSLGAIPFENLYGFYPRSPLTLEGSDSVEHQAPQSGVSYEVHAQVLWPVHGFGRQAVGQRGDDRPARQYETTRPDLVGGWIAEATSSGPSPRCSRSSASGASILC